MKKIFFILAALCCCFSVNAQNVGNEFEIANYGKFRITSTDPAEVALVKVSDGISDAGATFNTAQWNNITYKITSIKSYAFINYSNTNSKFKFGNLTTFESEAFNNTTCYEINMTGSSFTELPKYAFYKCKWTRIYLPNSITTIHENAFQWSNVKEINLPNLTRIEGFAFYGCSSLSSIDLSHVTYLGGSAFDECSNMKNIALPQCLETVKEHAFEDCYLTSLSLYNTVNTFENSGDIMADNGTVTIHIVDWSNKNVLANFTGYNRAITYKYNDETITGEYTLPDGLTTLGEGALYHCTDITVIKMPESLTQIGAKAFAKCSNLCAIHCDAPTAPAAANANAFDEVDKNINIFIPDNAESYYSYKHATGWKDFYNYQVSLQTVKGAAIIELNHTAGSQPSQAVQGIIANYSAQINAAADKATVEALTQEGIAAIIAQIYIDRGVVKINNIYYILNKGQHTATVTYGGLESDGYATAEYTGNITIPATVEHENATYNVTLIGEHAFQNCTGLTAVTFPDDITEINKYAFYNCSKITNLVLPYNTYYIHSNAFSSCTGLKTLELPYKIQAIDNLAFENCSALTAITSLSPAPSALGYSPFNGVSKSIPVTVQESSLNAYQDDSWGGFTNFVTNTDLDAAKTDAKSAINEALGSYSSVSYIGNLALGFCQHIEASTTIDNVNSLRTEGVYAVTYSIKTYQATFGEMGEPCEDCPAVDVTKGTTTIRLYSPEKVEFRKME